VFRVYYPKRNLYIKVNINIIGHVILCGCETWSLILREGRMLRACDNMMLMKILGLWYEARGERRRQHADKLHD
jgi:hypothetical protein